MDRNFCEVNKRGWNMLIKNGEPFSNTSLPEYGPFMANEEKLKLFENIAGKKVLELGCASGKSLEYLKKKGAKEIWGLDISEEQIKIARSLNIENSKFFVSAMEENPGLPLEYFDYVLSLYSLGFSSDPMETLQLSGSYLKSGGKLILCWIHPFFNCIKIEENKLVVSHNYNDESKQMITKGPSKVELMQYNLKISTIINGIINSGMEIEQVIEENPQEKNGIGDYQSSYWDARKLKAAPTTLIIVARKR